MPTTLSRAELLEESIRQQQEELSILQTSSAMSQRIKAAADALRNFRTAVSTQRKQVGQFDKQIDEGLATLQATAASAHTTAHGLLVLSDDGKRRMDAASNTLLQLVLARFRALHQLSQSEIRLQEMETENAALPEHIRV